MHFVTHLSALSRYLLLSGYLKGALAFKENDRINNYKYFCLDDGFRCIVVNIGLVCRVVHKVTDNTGCT